MRLFFCPSAVNETASGFRWVLFPAFGQHKEVMLLKHKCPSPRIGEVDSICEISHELVLDNWQSVPHTIPQECPFRRQIIRQRRKAVRRR